MDATCSPGRCRGCARWLAYLDALTAAGQAVLAGVALSLGLDATYFAAGYTADPTILSRIFHYPPSPPHGGTITIQTRPGDTVLRVRIPVRPRTARRWESSGASLAYRHRTDRSASKSFSAAEASRNPSGPLNPPKLPAMARCGSSER
jgi:hypothetical protein